jgi:hypothetical protein
MRKSEWFNIGLCGAVAVTLGASAAAQVPAPDLVLLNGKVITVDAKDSTAQAIAIKDGKIVAVGDSARIAALAGPATKRIDLAGKTVTPGLIDTHAHVSLGGIQDLLYIGLAYPNAKNMSDVARLVKARVGASKPGEWVRGQGWDEGKLDERRYILASDIDAVSPNNPVFLSQTMGHYSTVNSVALKMAGITKDTPDPPGGTIDRLADGTPSGVLKEGAQNLVRNLIPDITPAEMRAGIIATTQAYADECVTAIKDPGIHQIEWDAYKAVLAEDRLPVRVFVLWRTPNTVAEAKVLADRVAPFTKPYVTTGDDRLISGGIKIGLDGSGGARTAWMHEDWAKDFHGHDVGNKGYPNIPPEIVSQMVKIYHDAGLHIGIHAIGDRGIDWTVDKYLEVEKAKPTKGLRHSIIHDNVPSDHAIDAMVTLQKTYDAGYPELQAPFLWWLGDTYSSNLGPQRSLRLNPLKTYVDRGILFAGGSDYPVTPIPARYGVWASVARETALGVNGPTPFGTKESVDVHTALRSYTDWGSRQIFLEKKTGTIEPGKYADLAVWDTDLYAAPTAKLKTMSCRMTLMGGKVVHDADS